MQFTVLTQSKRSHARLGRLVTGHGVIETPALIPVATQASVKSLSSEQVSETGTQALICNTFHLHLKPGERVIRSAGGLHRFMAWKKPLMTDSGGFQVFSLGFGRDQGVGKIGPMRRTRVHPGAQPNSVRITDDGVWFRSPLDGRRLFLGPDESMRIQCDLGADMTFAFDECTPPTATKAYTSRSLERTHRWAAQCLERRKKPQALFGIVQGGKYRDLRRVSAKTIGSMPFDGFGIGGEFGNEKATMVSMIGWVINALPDSRPRHLLGIGHPEDIPKIIRAGVDTFDCIAPTHYARHGIAFISSGRLDLNRTAVLKDRRPLDPKCSCMVCSTYSRSYLAHLFRAKELAAYALTTMHNLHFFNTIVATCRRDIRRGVL